jgi:uncharacterized membrane protein
LGYVHPIVIHFAIALLIVGVLFRCVSLTGRAAFAGRAAPCLILLATIAAVVAAQSGEDARIAVEALPGVGVAIRAHELWGARTRNIALVVAMLELLALALQRRADARALRIASAGVGVFAALAVLRAGQLGGELVYAHAGGVGIRSGDPADVGRLLLAGLYEQADVDEKAGRGADAASLLEVAARRFPGEAALQVRAAQALLEDRHDAPAALDILDRIGPIPDDARLRFRAGWLRATALDALGRPAEARRTLERLRADFPDDPRLLARLGKDR